MKAFSGKDGHELFKISGSRVGDFLGMQVSGAVDYDGDQRPEFLVGASGVRPRWSGAAYLFSGKDHWSAGNLRARPHRGAFGKSLTLVGDVNADGVADVAVGSADFEIDHRPAGMFRVYSGVPCSASRASYGDGWPGSNGVPALAAEEDPVICTSTRLDLPNSAGSTTLALLAIGLAEADLPTSSGGTLLVSPAWTLVLPLPAAGFAVPFTIPCDTARCGPPTHLQALELDAGASHDVAFSPGQLVAGGREQ